MAPARLARRETFIAAMALVATIAAAVSVLENVDHEPPAAVAGIPTAAR